MSERTVDYDFHLPDELIARHPAQQRDQSRMLVVHRGENRIEHRHFFEFPQFLQSDDLVVLNDARVIPARVFSDDRKVELLVLSQETPRRWVCMVKPGRRMRVGAICYLDGIAAHVEAITETGERILNLEAEVDLEKIGALPLPPYFGREEEPEDRVRYQTVFAKAPGAVAAPTAGLHFTPEILERVPHTFLTLHVGAGTFLPVKTDVISEHKMHSERYEIPVQTAEKINAAGRIVAVGTTVVRVLESCRRDENGKVVPQTGSTDIFLHPPKQVKHVDLMLTNFHLPKSTLLMLVSTLLGRETALAVYAEAVKQHYRFYSYGDCMLILP